MRRGREDGGDTAVKKMEEESAAPRMCACVCMCVCESVRAAEGCPLDGVQVRMRAHTFLISHFKCAGGPFASANCSFCG